jgi:HSP20 family molecular chaperone IbpA
MKKNTSYIMTFFFGAFFGAFILFNFWQPNIKKNKKPNANLNIKRFDRSFNSKDISKRNSKTLDLGDRMNKDIDDLKVQMDKTFNNSGSIFKLMEDSIQKAAIDTIGGGVGTITELYTKDSIILEMDVTNIDNSSMNIEVKNGEVSIKAEARIEESNKSKGSSSTSIMVSSFSRRLPVPEGTRASGLRLEYKDENTLHMIFPKTNK